MTKEFLESCYKTKGGIEIERWISRLEGSNKGFHGQTPSRMVSVLFLSTCRKFLQCSGKFSFFLLSLKYISMDFFSPWDSRLVILFFFSKALSFNKTFPDSKLWPEPCALGRQWYFYSWHQSEWCWADSEVGGQHIGVFWTEAKFIPVTAARNLGELELGP